MMEKPSPLRLASRSQLLTAFSCMWRLWIQLGEWVLPLEGGLYELTDIQHGVHALTAMKRRTAGWPGHAVKEASFRQVTSRESWARTLEHRGYEVPLKAPSHSESRQSMLGHICVLKKGGSIFINLRGIGCIRKDKCFGLKLILLLFMKGGHWTNSSRHCGPYDSFTPHTLTASSVGQGSLTTQLWEVTFSRYSFYSLGCKGFMKTKRHPPSPSLTHTTPTPPSLTHHSDTPPPITHTQPSTAQCPLQQSSQETSCRPKKGEIELQHSALPIHGRMNTDVARTDSIHTL